MSSIDAAVDYTVEIATETPFLGRTFTTVGTAVVGTAVVGFTFSWTEITGIRAISISRGRTDQLATWEAGRMTVVVDDRAGNCSSWNPASIYGTGLHPGVPIRCRAHYDDRDWPLFTGFIERITPSRPLGPDATASIQAFDLLGLLARDDLNHTFSEALSGAYIDELLDQVVGGVPSRSLDTGIRTIPAGAVTQGKQLAHLQEIASTVEDGQYWIDPGGRFVFRDAQARYTDPDSTTSQYTFGTGGVGIEDLTVDYSTDMTFNAWTVTMEGGTPQTSEDADSIELHGRLAQDMQSAYIDSDGTAALIAAWRTLQYAWPVQQIKGLAFSRNGSDLHWRAILGIDINQRVSIDNDSSQLNLDADFWVESIRHSIDFAKPHHTVTLTVSAMTPGALWAFVGSAITGTSTVAPF